MVSELTLINAVLFCVNYIRIVIIFYEMEHLCP